MSYNEGRHFVLHILKFAFQISEKHIPTDIQRLLNQFPTNERSKFSVNIAKALNIFIKEYMDFGGEIKGINSQEFQDVFDSRTTHHESLLEFLGYYSLKCVSECIDNTNSNSPLIFLKSVSKFFERIKKSARNGMDKYWNCLDLAATRIVFEQEMRLEKCSSSRGPFQINMSSEKDFIINVMNCVFSLFNMEEQIKLPREVCLQYSLTSSIRRTLKIIMDHQAERFALLKDYTPIETYQNLCTKSFNCDDFLQYCVCCTRQVVSEYRLDKNTYALQNACDHLVEVLQSARKTGKYTLFEQMEETAITLVKINDERIKYRNDRRIFGPKRKLENVPENPGTHKKRFKKDPF